MKISKYYLFQAAILAASCSAIDDPLAAGPENLSDISSVEHEMIVLGDKLEDPYSLENVQAALKAVYPTKAGRVDIKATDIYVRFLPEDDSDFSVLESLGVELMDHPLDYEIVRDGDYYHDPSLPADRITWQYAVLDTQFDFPEGIEYEILDECYIPSVTSTKTYQDIDWDAVEREAYILTGNADMLGPSTKKTHSKPSGRITIVDEDFDDGEPVGVAGVRVSCNSFVKFAKTYTDEEGYYSFDRSFTSNLRYRLVFKNKQGFAIGFNKVLSPGSSSALGEHSPEGVSVMIDSDSNRKLYCRSIVNNAGYDYYSKCTSGEWNVSVPPSNLRIWLFQNMTDSSTPMLRHGALVDTDLISGFLGEYRDLVKCFLPDITLGLKGMDSYSSIYSAAIHEFSHASHFRQAGKSYWNKYIEYILKSFVLSGWEAYGTGTESNAGYCEIGEMWGFYIENKLFKERYGTYLDLLGNSHWFSPQIFLYLDERGFDPGKIFSALTEEVNTREKLQDCLVQLYPEDSAVIVQAFNRYQQVSLNNEPDFI